MLGDPPGSDGPHGMALHPIPKLPGSAASPPLGARAAPACAGLGTLSTVLPVPRAATDHLGLRQGMCPGPRSTWGCHGQNHPGQEQGETCAVTVPIPAWARGLGRLGAGSEPGGN